MRKITVPICIMLIACVLLAGCSGGRQVEGKKLSIRLLDETASGTYTGVFARKLPFGEGGAFTSSDGAWTYTGTFAAGSAVAKDGELRGYPVSVTVDGVTHSGTYTGSIQDGRMTGTGKFSSSSGEFSYDGEWVDGKISGTGKITALGHTLSFQDREIEGTYNGEVKDAVPNGKGKFSAEDASLNYNGEWKDGALAGKGHLYDTGYTVHFSTGDRTGAYEGQVIDGVAEGSGSFASYNDVGVFYTYDGEWANGTFNGIGYCRFGSDDYAEDGHFRNGEFVPDLYELVKYIGSGGDDFRYKVSDPATEFLKQHPSLFPSGSAEALQSYLDPDAKYKIIMKEPEQYGGKIVRFENMQVLQIWDNPYYQFEHFTEMLLVDKATFRNYVFAFYPAELPDVQENDAVTVYGIPVNDSDYHVSTLQTNKCLVFTAAYVEKSE